MAQPRFQLGGVVTPDRFYGRKKEVRHLVTSVCSGQPSAITGDPRTGKTSLLHYISAEEQREKLYGELASKLIFQYLDAETFTGVLDQSSFWMRAFSPVMKYLESTGGLNSLKDVRQNWQAKKLDPNGVEKLLNHMQPAGIRLVLLLDEFDTVLDHPVLNQPEFYGSLRSLASRYVSVFTLVIASRQSIGTLNELTRKYYKSGSPYFNFLDEITLKNLSEREVGKFLSETCPNFAPAERQFVLAFTGGHPYMMQVGAASLWEAHQDGLQGKQVLNYVGEELLRKAAPILDDTWRLWAADVRKTFAIITLDAIPRLLGKREFDISALRASLADCMTEIRFLEQRGYICRDEDISCGWRVNGKILAIWLAEILSKSLREKDDLGRFLLEQSWDGLFKTGEKEQFFRAVSKMGMWLSGGVIVLVKAFAEGLIDGTMPG